MATKACAHGRAKGKCPSCRLKAELLRAHDALLNFGAGDRPGRPLGDAITALKRAIVYLEPGEIEGHDHH